MWLGSRWRRLEMGASSVGKPMSGPGQGLKWGGAWPGLCVRNIMLTVACQPSWGPKQDRNRGAEEVVWPTAHPEGASLANLGPVT